MADTRQRMIQAGRRKVTATDAIEVARAAWDAALAARYRQLKSEGLGHGAVLDRMLTDLRAEFPPEQLTKLRVSAAAIRRAVDTHRPR